MAIRDLIYPDDAIKVIESLNHALRYDASISILGVRCQDLPAPEGGPIGDVRVRASGKDEDAAVQRDAPILLSRMALLQMLSHFEVHVGLLLLQRRVLEHLMPDKRMQPGEMWGILKKVHQESRVGPVKVAFEKVVTSPSERLSEMRPWLEGLYAVRNCLAHRNGQVAIVDAAPNKGKLEQTQDTDVLRATWLNVSMSMNGVAVELPFVKRGGELEFSFNTFTRGWKIGDHIDLTPNDVQGICLAMSFVGNELLRCFEVEMNQSLGL